MSRMVKKRKMPVLFHLLASSTGVAVVIAGVLAAGSPLRTPFSVAAAANRLAPLVADKGKFRIMVNGQAVGKEEFEITPAGADWTAHAISEIQTPQGVTKVNGTLTVHSDGTPVHYDWSTQGLKKASSTIAFSGTGASVELHIEGARPFAQDFTFNTPLVSVLDNNLYHQYELLARLYDREAKGSQTFSVLVNDARKRDRGLIRQTGRRRKTTRGAAGAYRRQRN
jgi:hypothetical protein